MKGLKQLWVFSPQIFNQAWPCLSGSYGSASWAKLELSQAMLGHVEAICPVFVGHVVGFASKDAFPQQDQDFKWVSASYVGSVSGSSKATLWLRWCHLRANFGDFGVVLKAVWDHFGPCCFGIVKNNPKIHLRNVPPWP